MLHLPNSTVGKSVRAVISPSGDDTNSLHHQCDTGNEKDCHIYQIFLNEHINVDVNKLKTATRHQSASVIWKDSLKLRTTASIANKIPKNLPQKLTNFLKNIVPQHFL